MLLPVIPRFHLPPILCRCSCRMETTCRRSRFRISRSKFLSASNSVVPGLTSGLSVRFVADTMTSSLPTSSHQGSRRNAYSSVLVSAFANLRRVANAASSFSLAIAVVVREETEISFPELSRFASCSSFEIDVPPKQHEKQPPPDDLFPSSPIAEGDVECLAHCRRRAELGRTSRH